MNYKLKKWQLPFLAFLIIGTILIIRQQNAMPYHHDNGFVFGTVYNITYQNDTNLGDSIKAELARIDNSLSPFNEHSIISAVNRGDDIVVDDMFAEVFNKAAEVSRETDGAFDITVAPLVNLWGFGFKSGVKPTAHAIDSLRRLTGFHKVSLDNGHVRKADRRIMLDCGAIAKGYGSDIVARMMRRMGVKNFMIEIGGEIVTSGVSEKRVPWRIGVTKPIDDTLSTTNELQTILNVTDKAMATSGNYRNFYYKNGKKYAHTIDPKTGYPVQHNILSSTVIADDCATADAYATAFMVMGLEKARKVLERHPELMAYFIYSDEQGN
ncbi:MAG: FAD:protein FMN transferase, partial [Prevotella sp.]